MFALTENPKGKNPYCHLTTCRLQIAHSKYVLFYQNTVLLRNIMHLEILKLCPEGIPYNLLIWCLSKKTHLLPVCLWLIGVSCVCNSHGEHSHVTSWLPKPQCKRQASCMLLSFLHFLCLHHSPHLDCSHCRLLTFQEAVSISSIQPPQ